MSFVQPAPARTATPPPPAPPRTSRASHPEIGAPRESKVLARYLRDPSLRYTTVPFAGPGALRWLGPSLAFLSGLALILVPVTWQIVASKLTFWSLLVLPGIALALEAFSPLRGAILELLSRLRFARHLRSPNLGLERAVPQPGTNLRYEVHLTAKRNVSLDAIHVRLVFWENWRAMARSRFLRIPHRVTEKQGHDLVRHEVDAIQIPKGQHAVVRGSIHVPTQRPTEHYRGKPKHLSYVNVTVTIVADGHLGHAARGNCPHLVTFPWM